MTRLGVLFIALATAWSLPAGAVYWTLGASLSERVEANTNPGLDFDDEDGVEFGSTTNLSLVLGAQSGRTTWSLATGANLTFFTGENDGGRNRGDENLNGLRPNVNGEVVYFGQRYSVTTGANLRVTSTAFDEFLLVPLDDAGEPEEGPQLPTDFALARVDRDADRISFGAQSGLELQLSPRNAISVGISYSGQRYSESVPGFSTSDNFGGSLSFSRTLTPVSQGGVSLSILRFSSESNGSPNNQQGFSLSASADYSTRLTDETRLGASLGASYTDETDEVLRDGVLGEETDQTLGATGSLSLNVTLPQSRLSFRLNQGVRPSATGETRNVTSVSATYSQDLTQRTSLGFDGRYSLQAPINAFDDVEHFYGLGPSLNYQLSRSWRASLAYRFRGSSEEEGSAVSNAVSLTLSRDFDLLR